MKTGHILYNQKTIPKLAILEWLDYSRLRSSGGFKKPGVSQSLVKGKNLWF